MSSRFASNSGSEGGKKERVTLAIVVLGGLFLGLAPLADAGYIVQTIADTDNGNSPQGIASYNVNGSTTGSSFSTVGGGTASGTVDASGLLTSANDTGSVNVGGLQGTAFASADLASATLKASVSDTTGVLAVSTTAAFSDTLHFLIPNGASQITPIPIIFASGGTISTSSPNLGGFITDSLSIFSQLDNASLIAQISNGGPSGSCSVSYVPCIQTQSTSGFVSGNFSSDIPTNIVFTGFILVSGVTPSLTIDLSQLLSTQGATSVIDFSHTTSVIFELPNGVTYTSDSGVFGSASAVPEPASFGLIGAGLLAIAAAGVRTAKRRCHRG